MVIFFFLNFQSLKNVAKIKIRFPIDYSHLGDVLFQYLSLLENLVFKGIRGIKSDLERKNKLICQKYLTNLCHVTCRSKSFCSFLSTLYTTTYNIRFSTYSSNILYNNFNLVLKQTHSGTKTYQKLCYILVHKILFLIMCHRIVP